MKFNTRLKEAMQELGLKQSQVVELTGCSKGSISQYLSGKNVPSVSKQRDIAVSLGLDPDYFERQAFQNAVVPSRKTLRSGEFIRITPAEVGKIMHANHVTIERGLKDRRFEWGYAIPPEKDGGNWTYIINAKRFAEIEGVVI